MSDGELNEVAQYSTLDGNRGIGALEYSGYQWLQNRPPPQEVSDYAFRRNIHARC